MIRLLWSDCSLSWSDCANSIEYFSYCVPGSFYDGTGSQHTSMGMGMSSILTSFVQSDNLYRRTTRTTRTTRTRSSTNLEMREPEIWPLVLTSTAGGLKDSIFRFGSRAADTTMMMVVGAPPLNLAPAEKLLSAHGQKAKRKKQQGIEGCHDQQLTFHQRVRGEMKAPEVKG